MTVSLKDGRSFLYQWDTGRFITISGITTISHVDFAQKDSSVLCVEAEDDGSYAIPNILLQNASPITVYVVYTDDDGMETVTRASLQVQARPKPSDYIYTETECRTWADEEERIQTIVDGVNSVNVTSTQTATGATITTTNRNGVSNTVVISNGATGPQGPAGETYDDTEVRGDISQLRLELANYNSEKLSKPASGIAVGKYFRVASIDELGNPVLEACNFRNDVDSVICSTSESDALTEEQKTSARSRLGIFSAEEVYF